VIRDSKIYPQIWQYPPNQIVHIMTLPISIAITERYFSTMKIIKNG